MPVVLADGDAWSTVPLEEVLDGGRIPVALGRRFELNRLTGEYVAEGEPYWGSRLRFASGGRASG